jgi:hypothetical protein
MIMRLTLVFIGCCSVGAAATCSAQDIAQPTAGAAIAKLADEAIAADAEAVRSREYSRSAFVRAFLDGYANPEGTIPVNPSLSESRMNGAGWSAGQAYRRANPESVAQVMRAYGYREFEGAGAWTVGFEAGGFKPDAADGSPEASSLQSCWYLAFIRSGDLEEQLRQLVPRDVRLPNVTLRVLVKGYLSERGQFGHLGACQRQVYAVSVVADGG